MNLSKVAAIFFALALTAISFNLFAQRNSDSLLAQLNRKWADAKIYALKMAELMPEEFYDFKPVPEEMSFKQQLLHIADNIEWLTSSYLFVPMKKTIDDSVVKDKVSVIKILSDAYEMGTSAHHNLSNKQLDEIVPFFAGPMSRRQILILLHDHQTHHIGQIIVYLRLKGIKPPDYVGW
ncbi:MAG: DinB family protein [Ginsengibacter sp.]